MRLLPLLLAAVLAGCLGSAETASVEPASGAGAPEGAGEGAVASAPVVLLEVEDRATLEEPFVVDETLEVPEGLRVLDIAFAYDVAFPAWTPVGVPGCVAVGGAPGERSVAYRFAGVHDEGSWAFGSERSGAACLVARESGGVEETTPQVGGTIEVAIAIEGMEGPVRVALTARP